MVDGSFALLAKYGLPGQNIYYVTEAKLPQRNGFRGHKVIRGSFKSGGGPRAKAKWANAVLIPETQDTKTSNHGCAGVATLTLCVDFAESSKDVIYICSGLAELMKSMCVDVEAGKPRLATPSKVY